MPSTTRKGAAVLEWSDEQLMVRDAIRAFIDKEIRPNLDELEHGDTPPYEILRKLYRTFGMDAMAKDRFERQLSKEPGTAAGDEVSEGARDPNTVAFTL